MAAVFILLFAKIVKRPKQIIENLQFYHIEIRIGFTILKLSVQSLFLTNSKRKFHRVHIFFKFFAEMLQSNLALVVVLVLESIVRT